MLIQTKGHLYNGLCLNVQDKVASIDGRWQDEWVPDGAGGEQLVFKRLFMQFFKVTYVGSCQKAGWGWRGDRLGLKKGGGGARPQAALGPWGSDSISHHVYFLVFFLFPHLIYVYVIINYAN